MSSVLEILVSPTGAETHHVARVLLDRRLYRLAFSTSRLEDRWYMGLGEDGAALTVALVPGPDLIYPYRHLGDDVVPPGVLFVHAPTLTADPTIDDLRKRRARLYYAEAAA